MGANEPPLPHWNRCVHEAMSLTHLLKSASLIGERHHGRNVAAHDNPMVRLSRLHQSSLSLHRWIYSSLFLDRKVGKIPGRVSGQKTLWKISGSWNILPKPWLAWALARPARVRQNIPRTTDRVPYVPRGQEAQEGRRR